MHEETEAEDLAWEHVRADLEAEAERAHAGEARRLAWLASHPGFSDNANEWEEADGYALARKATGPRGAP